MLMFAGADIASEAGWSIPKPGGEPNQGSCSAPTEYWEGGD